MGLKRSTSHPRSATPIERLVAPFQRFTRTESAGGIVLLATTAFALAWANSAWAASYHQLWELPLRLGIGALSVQMSLHQLINDGLMAVFFFTVGLEIKREMLVGELASLRAATLPIAAALGGMVVPAAIYALLNAGGPGAAGWGIPMATDIAFAIGVLALVAPRAPIAMKIFLTALAIADDLGAVLVIALFYTEALNLAALASGVALLAALVAMNRLGARHPVVYAAVGVVLWLTLLESGIHATIAGVALAMTVPARTRIDTGEFLLSARRSVEDFDVAGREAPNVLTNQGQQEAIHQLEEACEQAQAPLMRLEHDLHTWVAFAIVPLFALSNAGVSLSVDTVAAMANPVTLGVLLGLVIGKPLGITLFSWLALRAGLASLSPGFGLARLHALSWLGGIGFTMSLFVSGLAFREESLLLDAAKLGILTASTVAAVIGYFKLRGESAH